MTTLETDRLRLRPFRASDIDAYAAMCADPEVTRFLGDGSPLTREDAWRQMAMLAGHWHLRGFGMWAVEEKSTGAFVGRVGLFYPDGWPSEEVGWTLAREYWGRGFAYEAARASCAYAFDVLRWSRIISLIAPDNHRSIAVAVRLGERYERDFALRDRPVHVYAIDRGDWRGSLCSLG